MFWYYLYNHSPSTHARVESVSPSGGAAVQGGDEQKKWMEREQDGEGGEEIDHLNREGEREGFGCQAILRACGRRKKG